MSGDERVRQIGIDSPEVNPDDCYADQATGHLAALVPAGTAVRLVYDLDRYDRYGRTLAYMYRRDTQSSTTFGSQQVATEAIVDNTTSDRLS